MIEDKLSRISALRPVSRTHFQSGNRHEMLTRMLGAESVSNALGNHMVARRWYPEPTLCDLRSDALRLLAPDAPAEALDPRHWLFLDTETTGLSGGTGTYAFLVGLAWWENDGLAVEQFFMRDHREEPSLLMELSSRLRERSVLVTFNGKSFDWPLLETRYRMTRVEKIEAPSSHLDLLHPARQLWRMSLKSVSLTEIERRVLSVDRGPDIPSETIPTRYFDFLRGGPAEPVAEIFTHNQMDLCGLALLAVHMCRMLENPETSECSGGELCGISRLLQRRGEHHLAGRIYQRALDCGLPLVQERAAHRELAYMAKRSNEFARANTHWEALLGATPEGLDAYEQLAKFYEHRAREPQRAATLTREALVKLQEAARSGRMQSHVYRDYHARFQHRLNRLTRKLGD